MNDIKVSDIKDMSLVLKGIDTASMEVKFKYVDLKYKYKDDSDFKLGYEIGMRQAVKSNLYFVNTLQKRK